jgi:hypothetical protein
MACHRTAHPAWMFPSVQAAAAVVAAMGLTAGTASADSPAPWQYGFQDTATSTAQVQLAQELGPLPARQLATPVGHVSLSTPPSSWSEMCPGHTRPRAFPP